MPHTRLAPTFLVGASQMVVAGAMTPLVPLYAVSLGASPTMVGIVAASSAALPLALGIWTGAAVDILGSRWMSVGGALGLALSAAILGGAPTVGWIVVGQAIAGMSNTVIIVANQTSVAQASHAGNRDRNFGFFAFWVSVGMLLGPLAGGFLADGFSIRIALYACAALALVPCVLALRIPGPAPVAGGPEPGMRPLRAESVYQAGWRLAQRRETAFVMLVAFVVIFAWSIKTSFYPLYLQSVGLSTASIGIIFSFFGASQMVVRPLIGTVAGRVDRRSVLMAAMILATLSIGATPFLVGFATAATTAIASYLLIGWLGPAGGSGPAG